MWMIRAQSDYEYNRLFALLVLIPILVLKHYCRKRQAPPAPPDPGPVVQQTRFENPIGVARINPREVLRARLPVKMRN